MKTNICVAKLVTEQEAEDFFLTVRHRSPENTEIDWTKDFNELTNYFAPASLEWLTIFSLSAPPDDQKASVLALVNYFFSHGTWWDFKLILFAANLASKENNKLSLIVRLGTDKAEH